MAQTSINIQPVKGGSEQHNRREKVLDYVRSDKPHEYWECASQADTLADINATYEKSLGRKKQAKSTPIREGVVVIEETTSMNDLKNLATELEARFGIRCFQIAIHKDEGHWHEAEEVEDISGYKKADRRERNGKTEVWKPNLHAHMVFDWTDEKGKCRRLNKADMAQMQTLVADVLHMERGVSSDKKHLTAIQQKTEAEKANLRAVIAEKQRVEEDIRTAKKTLQSKNMRVTARKAYLTMMAGAEYAAGGVFYIEGAIFKALGAVAYGKRIGKVEESNFIYSRRNDNLESALKKAREEVCERDKRLAEKDEILQAVASRSEEGQKALNLWGRIKDFYQMKVTGGWFKNLMKGLVMRYSGNITYNSREHYESGTITIAKSGNDICLDNIAVMELAKRERLEQEQEASWRKKYQKSVEKAEQETLHEATERVTSSGRGLRR